MGILFNTRANAQPSGLIQQTVARETPSRWDLGVSEGWALDVGA